jgi:hypothetical protein
LIVGGYPYEYAAPEESKALVSEQACTATMIDAQANWLHEFIFQKLTK